jgi:hypothetical protein
VEPRTLSVGKGLAGEERSGTLEVRNGADHPIRLVGGTSNCSCAAIRDLPADIPAGEMRLIRVTVTIPPDPGKFVRKAFLFTDDEQERFLEFNLAGESTPMGLK